MGPIGAELFFFGGLSWWLLSAEAEDEEVDDVADDDEVELARAMSSRTDTNGSETHDTYGVHWTHCSVAVTSRPLVWHTFSITEIELNRDSQVEYDTLEEAR
jgi:hypothetical protein